MGRRIAGDSSTYATRVTVELGTRDEAGAFTPKHERTIDLDLVSASTVAKLTDKGDGLLHWAYDMGLKGVEVLGLKGRDVSHMALEELKAELSELGYTPSSKRGKAADRGSAAHDIAERLLRGEDVDKICDEIAVFEVKDATPAEVQEIRGYCYSAVSWYLNNKDTMIPLLIEEPVVFLTSRGAELTGSAGTLDLYALRWSEGGDPREGRTRLTDFKTAKDTYVEHVSQLSGYDLSLRQWGYEPDEVSTVLFRADGSSEEKLVEVDHQAFLDLLDLYPRHRAIDLRLHPPAICVTCQGRSTRKVLERNNGACAKCGPREEA